MKQTKPEIAEIVALQVRKYRRRAELTQSEVAIKCGIFRTYLSRIEGANANPSISVLADIAVVLKVPVADLVQETPDDYI